MPTSDIGQRVKNIVGLTVNEVAELTGQGIQNEDDLRYIEFEDLPEAIPIVKRRKLSTIKKYLSRGSQLTATLTMQEVQESLNPMVQVPPGAQPGAHPAVPDPTRGALKMYTNPLPEFSGDPVDYETWERKTKSIIKQSNYKTFVDRPATTGNVIEEARSTELFHMIYSCVGEGHALNVFEKVRDDNDNKEFGHAAWVALKAWYLDDTQKETMIKHYEAKMDSIILDKDTTATNYINNLNFVFEHW